MDDRGYVAQALFDRLSGDSLRWRLLGDSEAYPERAQSEVQLAVEPAALAGIPRALARFCHDLDLQLVQLVPEDSKAWRFVLAWSDEVGRPRFMSLRVCSDYCRGLRCYLRSHELLAPGPETLLAHGLIDAVENGELPAEREEWLCALWNHDPRSAIERVARFWPSAPHIRLIAQAAKHGDWGAVRASLVTLRRALRRAVWPEPGDILAGLGVAARSLAEPRGASVAFLGRESGVRGAVRAEVARDLAPLGLTLHEGLGGADLRLVLDSKQGLPAMVVDAERAILRWLECRVERRFPQALVGDNPAAARVLQFAVRHRIPGVQLLLNCDIRCRLDSPVLMPYPFGIVIGPGTQIGSRVTLMQQVSILGGAIVEDNVTIGPGARISGAIRIGRGATIGPNAVVSEDVPSHDTVVVEKRRPLPRSVVNA